MLSMVGAILRLSGICGTSTHGEVAGGQTCPRCLSEVGEVLKCVWIGFWGKT